MRQKTLTALLALSLLLSGCSWSVSPYVSVTPHKEQQQNSRTDVVTASNYLELLESLKAIIADGVEVSAINVAEYPASTLAHGMERAVQYALLNDPIGAYAGTKHIKPAALPAAFRHQLRRLFNMVKFPLHHFLKLFLNKRKIPCRSFHNRSSFSDSDFSISQEP